MHYWLNEEKTRYESFYSCIKCNRKFITETYRVDRKDKFAWLIRHRLCSMCRVPPRYECPDIGCLMSYRRKAWLAKHLINIHETSEEDVTKFLNKQSSLKEWIK